MRLMMAVKQGQPLPLIEPLRPAAPPAITARADHATTTRAAATAPYTADSPLGHAASSRTSEADDAGAPLQLSLALLPIRVALAPSSLGAALRCVRSLLPKLVRTRRSLLPKRASQASADEVVRGLGVGGAAPASPLAAMGEAGSEGVGEGAAAAAVSGGEPPVTPRNDGLALEVRLAECACELWLLLPPELPAPASTPASLPASLPAGAAAPVAAAAAQVGVCLRLRAGGSLLKAAASQQLDLEVTGVDCRVATLASHADPVTVARRRASYEQEALAAHAAATAAANAAAATPLVGDDESRDQLLAPTALHVTARLDTPHAAAPANLAADLAADLPADLTADLPSDLPADLPGELKVSATVLDAIRASVSMPQLRVLRDVAAALGAAATPPLVALGFGGAAGSPPRAPRRATFGTAFPKPAAPAAPAPAARRSAPAAGSVHVNVSLPHGLDVTLLCARSPRLLLARLRLSKLSLNAEQYAGAGRQRGRQRAAHMLVTAEVLVWSRAAQAWEGRVRVGLGLGLEASSRAYSR